MNKYHTSAVLIFEAPEDEIEEEEEEVQTRH